MTDTGKNVPTALIIDDEPDLLSLLSITMRRMGIESHKATDVKTARELLENNQYDLCLTDLRLPDGSGLDIVRQVQQQHNGMPIAVITAFGDPKSAVEALKLGAFDYVSKPVEIDQLQVMIETALKLQPEVESTPYSAKLLGESEVIEGIRTLISKVSRNQAPVHIFGETGTGKELVAKLIHEGGPRAAGPFVAVNCGAIPRELMESEFFGHKKGSFTGAYSDKKGLFEAANGGTLFLDEIAELPQDLQVKLLRTIQEKKVRAIGDIAEKHVDVRLISATHKDLQEMIRQSEFREDLFYRINVIPVHVPSLKYRREDIEILSRHFLTHLSEDLGMETPEIDQSAFDVLRGYDFPGNVRELENIIERTLALHDGGKISAADIILPTHSSVQGSDSLSMLNEPIEQHLNRIESDLIQQALSQTNGNITEAAKLLGTTFRSLRYKIKKLEIR
ncbi:MAG: sigma-54 dependent transcriptional regulator [Pseudomonadota bacterium]